MRFEEALVPARPIFEKTLSSYQLFIDIDTRTTVFHDALRNVNLVDLRLSGHCRLEPHRELHGLRRLTVYGANGHYIEQALDDRLSRSGLEQFQYAPANRNGFKLRDVHLDSLARGPSGVRMTKLVLLGVELLTSTAITNALKQMLLLEYFALSFIISTELRCNFALALPPLLSSLKLKLTNGRFAPPHHEEQEAIFKEVVGRFLLKEKAPDQVCICTEYGVLDRNEWKGLARKRGISVRFYDWEEDEII